ncbi:MAG: DUF5689 domain-containing protein [Bacteroidales bacterium]|jgi:hypothetical protein
MKTKKLLSAIVVVALTLVMTNSCIQGEFDKPPIDIPEANLTANKTIAELKTQFNTDLDSISEDIIIKGIVVANDESGNLYKKLVIQDETAGIELALDRNSLYTEYRLGQLVYVKCQGMYIGKYAGLHQLGYIYENSIGRLPEAYIDLHLFRDSLPGPVPAPKVIAMSDNNIKSYLSMLVQFDDVSFPDAGSVWATQSASATNRDLVDNSNNKIIVRTSKYANFAGLIIPSGKGTVKGILNIFNNDLQLTIRDTSDVLGFVPFVPAFFEESFANGIGDFIAHSVIGTQQWIHDANYSCMKMSGYQGGTNHQNEDWLISPSLDLSGASSIEISFDHAINKGNVANLESNHTLWVCENYNENDFAANNWHQVTIDTYPAGTNWIFVNTTANFNLQGNISNLSNVRFAFKYLCSDSESATWEIKNVRVKKQ